jgi:hypothetical protein
MKTSKSSTPEGQIVVKAYKLENSNPEEHIFTDIDKAINIAEEFADKKGYEDVVIYMDGKLIWDIAEGLYDKSDPMAQGGGVGEEKICLAERVASVRFETEYDGYAKDGMDDNTLLYGMPFKYWKVGLFGSQKDIDKTVDKLTEYYSKLSLGELKEMANDLGLEEGSPMAQGGGVGNWEATKYKGEWALYDKESRAYVVFGTKKRMEERAREMNEYDRLQNIKEKQGSSMATENNNKQ